MAGKLGLVILCFFVGLGGTLWLGAAATPAGAEKSAEYPVPKSKPTVRQKKPKPAPTASDAANAVCFLAANTRYRPGCEVNGFESRIDLTIGLNRSEAMKVCLGMAEIVSNQTKLFRGRGWTIRVAAPGGRSPLAACGIR